MQQEKLGKYDIRGTLGRGAMGVVYEGWDPAIARRVAIKTVRVADNADNETTQSLARFKREAQAAGRLNHPNIVGVFDYGETDEVAFIVMEFIDGGSLKELLDRGEHLVPAEIVRVMTSLLAGLQYSHDRGVVHRDIKPANIMFTSQGQVKIADFGIARIESSSMTQVGTVMGTPAYMSPEQFVGQTVDRRTDIYSAGVVLYQMVTGDRPFDGSMSAIMHKALNVEPPRPSELSVVAPAALDAVVAKAMAKRPENRFETADAFARALCAVFKSTAEGPSGDAERTVVSVQRPERELGTGISAGTGIGFGTGLNAATDIKSRTGTMPPENDRQRHRSVGPILSLGALILLAAGGGAAWYMSGRHNPAPSSDQQTTRVEPPAALAQDSPPQVPSEDHSEASPNPISPPPAAPAPSIVPANPVAKAPEMQDIPNLAALREALRPIGCTFTKLAANDAGPAVLEGLSGAGEPEAALRGTVGTAVVDWRVRRVDGHYCPVLDMLRDLDSRNPRLSGTLSLALRGDASHLAKGSNVVVRAVMPDFPALLQVDYLASDGLVTHLVHDDGTSVRVTSGDSGAAAWKREVLRIPVAPPCREPAASRDAYALRLGCPSFRHSTTPVRLARPVAEPLHRGHRRLQSWCLCPGLLPA